MVKETRDVGQEADTRMARAWSGSSTIPEVRLVREVGV